MFCLSKGDKNIYQFIDYWYCWQTKFCIYDCPIYRTTLCCDEVIYVIRYLSWNVSYCFRSFEIFLLSTNDTSVWVNFFWTLTCFKLNFNRFSMSSLNSGGLFCRRDSHEKQSWPQKTMHLLLPLTSSYFSNFQAKVVW